MVFRAAQLVKSQGVIPFTLLRLNLSHQFATISTENWRPAVAFPVVVMQAKIHELLERAHECFAQARASKHTDAKRKLELIGNQLLLEAHDLADKHGDWIPLRKRRR